MLCGKCIHVLPILEPRGGIVLRLYCSSARLYRSAPPAPSRRSSLGGLQ
jgi:hypothetical protein